MSRRQDRTTAAAAYDRHFDDLERAIAAVCRRYQLPRNLIADFTQDVHVHVLTRATKIFGSYEERCAPYTYLFSIVKNHMLNWWAAQRRLQLTITPELATGGVCRLRTSVEDAETAWRTNRVLHALAAAREQLRAQDRWLLSLRFDEALSVPTIANQMSISQKAASNRLSRLAQSLHKKLLANGVSDREALEAIEYMREYAPPPAAQTMRYTNYD